jgi:drug/metabolite transporter (DMT)-like permease
MEEPAAPRRAALPALVAGFAVIYLVWGSTYLGMKFAVQTLPPFLMAGVRFVVAGSILYALRRAQGVRRPEGMQWRGALVTGALMLLGGNGLVCWAQQTVPSGTAALLVATTPMWMGLLAWLFYGGARPTARVVLGMVVGFAGAALLVKRTAPEALEAVWPGMLATSAAPVLWSLGSLQTRRAPATQDALLMSAMQMLAGGVLMRGTGTRLGEWSLLAERSVSARSLWALAYLTVVGSLVAFTTYAWLLRVTSPAAVATYAYVNPLVAVLLGWLLGGEGLEAHVLVAGALIVGAVVLITLPRRSPRVEDEPRAGAGVLPRAHAGAATCCTGGER